MTKYLLTALLLCSSAAFGEKTDEAIQRKEATRNRAKRIKELATHVPPAPAPALPAGTKKFDRRGSVQIIQGVGPSSGGQPVPQTPPSAGGFGVGDPFGMLASPPVGKPQPVTQLTNTTPGMPQPKAGCVGKTGCCVMGIGKPPGK